MSYETWSEETDLLQSCVHSIREYQNFPNSYLLFTKVSMHLSISHSLCSAVHNYDSLCRRSSRSPIMLSILLVSFVSAFGRAVVVPVPALLPHREHAHARRVRGRGSTCPLYCQHYTGGDPVVSGDSRRSVFG